MALNVTAYSLYANPRVMTDVNKQRALKELPKLVNIDPNTLKNRLNKKKYFVWIKRKVNMEIMEEVKKLKIKGISFINESKRFYPNGSLAAHIIGFAGIDNQGLEGLELSYDQFLKGKSGWSQILRDARQRDLLIEKEYVSPQDGFNIVLTIDETIQYIAERALDKAFKKNKALSGTIIVVDIKTGEILALSNRPTYNLEDVKNSSLASRTNRAVSFVYEPGSVFKIVTLAAALEEDAFVETDQIFCENGEYRVANHILHDHKPHGMLSFSKVFEKSSNIGVTKVAQKLGADNIYKYGKRFRFGNLTGIDLRGEVRGVFKDPKRWSKTSIGAIPIGHEMLATPLQLVAAMAAVANDGVYMRPYVVKYIKDNHNELIKSFHPRVVDRVISKSTSDRMKIILTAVVDSGTGKRARIKGVHVAGKTGTAQKVIDGQYSHSKFYASFMGFAPSDNPRVAAIVVFDEPRPSYFGGTVSAPVFKEVIENTLKYLESSNVLSQEEALEISNRLE